MVLSPALSVVLSILTLFAKKIHTTIHTRSRASKRHLHSPQLFKTQEHYYHLQKQSNLCALKLHTSIFCTSHTLRTCCQWSRHSSWSSSNCSCRHLWLCYMPWRTVLKSRNLDHLQHEMLTKALQENLDSPPSALTLFAFRTTFTIWNGILKAECQYSTFSIQNIISNWTLCGRMLNGIQHSSLVNSQTEHGVHIQHLLNHVSSVLNWTYSALVQVYIVTVLLLAHSNICLQYCRLLRPNQPCKSLSWSDIHTSTESCHFHRLPLSDCSCLPITNARLWA